MKKRVVRIVVGVFAVCALLGGTVLGVIRWQIHRSVQQYSEIAQKAHPHPDDDVAALIDFMNSDSHKFRDRNLAVWTLGRLCDAQALSALESAYTGKPCEHDKKLCQHELSKAITLCGGIPTPPLKTKQ